MNRKIFIATIILSMCLIVACQIFTPIPETSTREADSFVLVSDVDDTVKLTNVLNKKEMIKNAFNKLVFAGMPKLYRSLLGENSPTGRLMFLSGSPDIFGYEDIVREFLKNADFPHHRLTLRGGIESTCNCPFDYKAKHMKELYGKSCDNFILIGDDTENDPEVYAYFATTLKPKKVLAIYIHKITGHNLPSGSVAFVTAYDIAIHEFLAGRLTEKQAADVGNAVLDKQKDKDTFFPKFQQCPDTFEQYDNLPENLIQLKQQIEDKITELCSKRTNACQSRP